MNVKQTVPVAEDKRPVYLHEITVGRHRLGRGMLVSVNRRPGLPGGKWEFTYAEPVGDTMLIHVEGPLGRERRHRVIRPADVKTVHVKSERRR